MAGRTMAEIWVAVRPDTSKTGAELDRKLGGLNVSKSGEKVGDSFGSGFGRSMKRLAGLAAGALASKAIAGGVKDSVDAASDLNETVNKSNVIFGKNAAAINAWSKGSVRAFGLSQQQALSAAAGFGDMFTQIGFTGDASAKMSKSVVGLAADLGSFNNLGTDDVLNRLSAAFRGEFDSLQAVIPNINAARVETEALAATGKKSAKELTAQEQAAATLAIVQRDGARAAGDFAKTSGGLANQQKIAAAQTEQLKTTIGAGLLPVWISGATILNDKLLPPLIDLATKYAPQLSSGFETLSATAGPLVKDVLSKAADTFQGLATGTSDASPALASLADSGAKLAPVVTDLVQKVPSFTDVLSVGAEAVGFLADHTDELGKAMPFLVAGIIAYKVAQAAANVAALLAVPVKVSEVLVNRQLVKSNKELIASRAGLALTTGAETVATTANTTAKNAGILATIRQKAATVASSIATKAVAGVTAIWTGAQWLLNAALTANPIGLVIAAIALLAIGFALAWKKSETFRDIVTGGFNGIKTIAITVIDFVWRTVSGFFGDLIHGAAKAFGWVPGIGDKLETADAEFAKFRDNVNDKLADIKDQSITVKPVFDKATMSLASAGRRAMGGPIHGPGTGTSDTAGLFALSNNEHVWTAKEVAAAGGHAAVYRMRKAVLKGADGFAAGGAVSFGVRTPMPNTGLFAKEVAAHAVAIAKPVAQQLANQFGGTNGPATGPGGIRSFRGKRLNERTIGMLLQAERILGRIFHITQGSYSTSVSASAGTHAGGGAMDTNGPGGWTRAVTALRRVGFAAWHRTPGQGPWNHHIHSIAIGDPSASAAAKRQVASFLRGGNGLRGMAAGGPVGQALAAMGVTKFDQGGQWKSGTLGVNMSGQTETVLAGGTEVRLHRDTIRVLAKELASAARQMPINLDSKRVSDVFAARALSDGY